MTMRGDANPVKFMEGYLDAPLGNRLKTRIPYRIARFHMEDGIRVIDEIEVIGPVIIVGLANPDDDAVALTELAEEMARDAAKIPDDVKERHT